MKVSAIMTAGPRTITLGASLDEALRLMDAYDVRHLPVLEHGRLVGILSDRELLEHTGWLPKRVHAARGPGMEERVPSTVREIMRAPVVTISPSDTAVTAAVEFLGRRVGSLPVVEDERLVGILTEMDMVRAFVQGVRDTGSLPGLDPPVERVMTEHPTTVDVGATLAQAGKTMQVNDVRHLPVLDRGQLIGMFSDRDARRAIGAGRRNDTRIDEVMTENALTVGIEDPVSRAAVLMSQRKFSALPVVSADRLVGILTLTDVLDHCLEALREMQPAEGGA